MAGAPGKRFQAVDRVGRAIAVHFAREGADVMIGYLEEAEDAEMTRRMIEKEGRNCGLFAGDIGDPEVAEALVQETIYRFGRIDITGQTLHVNGDANLGA